ncbi:4Fe-4S dicluster domain-containing protein [Andreprevotia lacus DSM 23236]|jgi:NAD-dependent dihydropyrimidine dehydrogenase PreA subunit|uniref:4Fe-4S dicluster domain-containing protein n=1 Tax=Andreprevotia lacus DSM 23236 TaxID=1121001 RepID=A0A1W1XFD2_9NEIS|nr:ferredoxin family protein [Andreprevotia lacus]SMC22646.1 4Fe-4S dicluster domain-containing protein [Andreprevotia lacus DSM 23236]
MIELVSAERCINCDLCVRVCPTNVFDAVPGDNPVIARQQDCQTCFMCEAYCPVDALYVAPFAEQHIAVDEQALNEDALLGSYRRAICWSPGSRPQPDQSFRLLRGG